ncbi:MAG: NAD(P)/FAD-dependent oxidoreductase [Thermodesulfobacteriota bacterium]|nr:NAD(P)/FAD-dependent oxidoreductase [Thermodesulfobacteriota bacterium]
MAEKFDIIIVGGGHNGLACGAYLAKAGQKVIVFERRDLVGGGVMTEEITLPGFKHNTHSAMHEWIFMGPVYYDLELKKYGALYKFAPGLANVFEDGSSIVLYRDLDRTVKQIEKFSKKDAVTYREIVTEFLNYSDLVVTSYLFNAPMSASQWASRLEGTHAGREFLRMMASSSYYIIDELFENEKVKAWLMINVTQSSIPQDSFGSGLIFPSMHPALHKCGIGTAVGGSISLAKAMGKVIEANGGVVKNNSEVKEIMVKNGVAQGIRLSDGTEYLANKAVACNVGPTLIFGEGKMIGKEHLDETFLKQISHWRPGEVALFTFHMALNEQIRYKAADKEPDVDRCYTVGMVETVEVLQKQFNAIRIGEIPRGDAIGFLAVHPTVVDSTQAPAGKHTAFIWQFAVNTKIIKGGPEKWDEVKEEYQEECLRFWAKYTKNLDKEGVILAKHSDSPLDIARKNPSMIYGDLSGGSMDQDQITIFRPFHGYPPYHTPIENLFMCGPSTHSGGGCSAAPGYNAANAIAEALKIKKWWKTPAYFGGAPEEEM